MPQRSDVNESCVGKSKQALRRQNGKNRAQTDIRG